MEYTKEQVHEFLKEITQSIVDHTPIIGYEKIIYELIRVASDYALTFEEQDGEGLKYVLLSVAMGVDSYNKREKS